MKHHWRTDFALILKNGERITVSDEGEYFYVKEIGTCTHYDGNYGAKWNFEWKHDFHITTGFGDGKTIIRTISNSSIAYIECIPESQLVYDTDTPESQIYKDFYYNKNKNIQKKDNIKLRRRIGE